MANYIVKRNGEVIFTGAFTKHIMGKPYCAVFKEYPAAITQILLLREANIPSYQNCELFSCSINEESIKIGNYIPIGEAKTEKEMLKRFQAQENGIDALLGSIR